MNRTYGTIQYHAKIDGYFPDHLEKLPYNFVNGKINVFIITAAEPHVCIRLKSNFPKINEGQTDNYEFANTPEHCHDLLWFVQRYPLQADATTLQQLKKGSKKFLQTQKELESLLSAAYVPQTVLLNSGYQARDYQLRASEVMIRSKKMILADELGLGKSLTATLCLFKPKTLPALVVVQSHMTTQWKTENFEKFTNLKAHIIYGFKQYQLPVADVYIINYHCLSKWIDVLIRITRTVVFDECQELRKGFSFGGEVSAKYLSAYNLCDKVNYAWGLSGSPIYNYGDEIFNILDCLNRGCLGRKFEFLCEWCESTGHNYKVKDTKALGTYLREKFLMLRRTAAEVGRELPQVNTVVHPVEYDEHEVETAEKIAKQLAMSYLTATNFAEKGNLAMEFDTRLRQITGIAKAHHVASLVQILLESGEPVLLSGWHRQVYEIWLNDLQQYNPVLYTGSESAVQKDKAKKAFINGETNLFIISNRSGIGLDGLQHRCRYVVHGELDWSPQVHKQITGRVNRDGQKDQVTVIFPVCEFGSDPGMVTVLGIKSEQSHNIIDPHLSVVPQYTDESRVKLMAETFLKNSGVDVSKLALVVKPDGNLDIEEKKE